MTNSVDEGNTIDVLGFNKASDNITHKIIPEKAHSGNFGHEHCHEDCKLAKSPRTKGITESILSLGEVCNEVQHGLIELLFLMADDVTLGGVTVTCEHISDI